MLHSSVTEKKKGGGGQNKNHKPRTSELYKQNKTVFVYTENINTLQKLRTKNKRKPFTQNKINIHLETGSKWKKGKATDQETIMTKVIILLGVFASKTKVQ